MKKTASSGEREKEREKRVSKHGKKNTRIGRGLRVKGRREGWRHWIHTSFDDAFLFSKQTREERRNARRPFPSATGLFRRIRISARIRIGERE